MTAALQVIRVEHDNYRAVLACLRRLLLRLEQDTAKRERALLFAILDYVEAFPATFHHPKEDEHLFAALRRRRPAAADLLDRLEREHVEMLDQVAAFRAACEAYRADPRAAAVVRERGLCFVASEQAHIECEERDLLPLAARALRAEDWTAIDRAFARNDDPLFGPARAERFERLFHWIVEDSARAPQNAGQEADLACDR